MDLDLELLFSCYYCSKIYRSSSNRFPPTSAVPIFANLSEYWDHLARGHGGDLVGLAQFSEEDQKFDLLYDWIIKTERNEQQKEDVRPGNISTFMLKHKI